MAQFDVYRNLNNDSAAAIPYLLDVQTDLLEHLATRLVVPLIQGEIFGATARILNPVFEVEHQRVVMSTAEAAGIARKALGEKVCSLKVQRTEILDALDFLITGI